jgi:excisionase family DNA binding protein
MCREGNGSQKSANLKVAPPPSPALSAGAYLIMHSGGPHFYMSEREAAAYLKVSIRTMINWRLRGLIPYFRIGRSIRYSRQIIDRTLLERHQRNTAIF